MMQDYVRTGTYQRAILQNHSDFKDKVGTVQPSLGSSTQQHGTWRLAPASLASRLPPVRLRGYPKPKAPAVV